VCEECRDFTGGIPHPYIPLLATNPTTQGKGYGTSIVRHLIDEAALLVLRVGCHDVLFLDVYTTSHAAIRVYGKCGFETVTSEPISDPDEDDQTYIIMGKRVSIS
jgi:ribosomal protein S18 acetylase RimI-like enzyme